MNWKAKLYKQNKLCVLVIVSLLLFNCKNDTRKQLDSRVTNLPFYKEASFTPHWLESGSEAQKTFHQIPAFSLTNQEGETITEATFKDKIYVTDFFFTTCPGICPKMTANMNILQQEFKTDAEILLLSHSVTPEIDSVSVLKSYAENKGIESNKWHLVTGERSQIYDLGRNHYFVEEDLGETKTNDDFLHTENFVLIDKNRQIRGIYNGLNKTAVQQLIADIKTLQLEN
ncbi:SCO family protein [Kordia sp. YSTF-M3]|uniref:SCO family protein n=1 Tax=Kordia aestuariivivens TaxID=2759037 RepID=A0ABR7Q7K4_9FLAO|nr:SCO family protein [Kordia aestuariivivens]